MRLPFTGERFIPGFGGPGIHLEHLHRYYQAASMVSGSVLDLGCGVGYGSRLLSLRAERVVGLDVSPGAVRHAQDNFSAANLRFLAGDCRSLPFSAESFDWIVCFELIEHVAECEMVVAEIRRVLAPEGRLFISTPNRPQYSEARGYSNPYHVREFDTEEYRALLMADFEQVTLWGQGLFAGSRAWLLGGAPSETIEVYRPNFELALDVAATEEPIYLVALCSSRGDELTDSPASSMLPGRLEAFIEQREADFKERQEKIQEAYDSVIQQLQRELSRLENEKGASGSSWVWASSIARLTEQLKGTNAAREALEQRLSRIVGERADLAAQLAAAEQARMALETKQLHSDEANAQLGAQLERLQGLKRNTTKIHQRLGGVKAQMKRLAGRIAVLREEKELLEARFASLQEKESTLNEQLSASERKQEALRNRLSKVSADRDWSYGQWQKHEAELRGIRQSKMWHIWMAYHAVRRAILRPFSWARELISRSLRSFLLLSTRAGRSFLRLLGWLYLLFWTVQVWLRAAWRRWQLEERKSEPAVSGAPLKRRPRVLMVCPYSIYPPYHGGGVRLYNLIRRLGEKCELFLFVFIRAEDDPVQREALAPLVRKLYFHNWDPALKPDRWGLRPPSAQLFDSPEVDRRLCDILSQERIDILQLEFTEMGQYGLRRYSRVKVVLSEIDITFRSRARRRALAFHRRYYADRNFGHSFGDWMRQLNYELKVVRRADQVHVMSADDGNHLAPYLAQGWHKLREVRNGVDTTSYLPPPRASRNQRLLFVGNFQHLPNLDALDHLMSQIWPRIRERVPQAELAVVGSQADQGVTRYHGSEGVTVVGEVASLKPYYQGYRALLAPIRAGSGTRLKILEALACGMPVVSTTLGAEGIAGVDGKHFLIADGPQAFAEAVHRLLEDDELCDRLGREGRLLVEELYDWDRSADALLAGYSVLLADDGDGSVDQEARGDASRAAVRDAAHRAVEISIVIPTLNGGATLGSSLDAVSRQETRRPYEILCVDSGSVESDLAAMKRYGARVVGINKTDFNHGLTRDLGAELSSGQVLVYLNQDAVPCDEHWLENLTAPLFGCNGHAAVQGAILELPDRDDRFYWHSCGERFYFTRESKRWMEAYFGIGFSTVNAAIRREVWERFPFGEAPIMEDKKWQRQVVDAGHSITVEPIAAVYHTHKYGFRSLVRRCRSEGFGWRTLGERYSFADMVRDMAQPRIWGDWARGLARGQIRSGAELLFPCLRPFMLYWGNHWSRK